MNDGLNPVMEEVFGSNQLARGGEDKNIPTGDHEIISAIDFKNKKQKGGLGLPNISVKADSLLMKQLCRMLGLEEDSYHLVGYWMGSFLQDTGHRTRSKLSPIVRSRSSLPHHVQEVPSTPVYVGHLLGVGSKGEDQERQPEGIGSDNGIYRMFML